MGPIRPKYKTHRGSKEKRIAPCFTLPCQALTPISAWCKSICLYSALHTDGNGSSGHNTGETHFEQFSSPPFPAPQFALFPLPNRATSAFYIASLSAHSSPCSPFFGIFFLPLKKLFFFYFQAFPFCVPHLWVHLQHIPVVSTLPCPGAVGALLALCLILEKFGSPFPMQPHPSHHLERVLIEHSDYKKHCGVKASFLQLRDVPNAQRAHPAQPGTSSTFPICPQRGNYDFPFYPNSLLAWPLLGAGSAYTTHCAAGALCSCHGSMEDLSWAVPLSAPSQPRAEFPFPQPGVRAMPSFQFVTDSISGAAEVTQIHAVNARSWLQVSTVQRLLLGLHKEAFNLALIGRWLYVK